MYFSGGSSFYEIVMSHLLVKCAFFEFSAGRDVLCECYLLCYSQALQAAVWLVRQQSLLASHDT